jgi:hypothetical protein
MNRLTDESGDNTTAYIEEKVGSHTHRISEAHYVTSSGETAGRVIWGSLVAEAVRVKAHVS